MKRILAFVLVLAMTLTLFCGVTMQSASAATLWGIDVSKWQGDINWASVKSAGVDFAILRAYCNGKDTYFDANYAGAKAAGVPIGVYMYVYGDTTAEIQAETNALINILKGKQFEYPIYVDIENADYFGDNTKSFNADLVITACTMLENAGYFAGVYTYTSFAQSYIDMSKLTGYTTWIADYRSSCGYTGTYSIWQYSQTGSVNGISGAVDLNYCYKTDFEATIKAAGLNGFEATPTVLYPYENTDGSLMLYDGEITTPASTDFNTTLSLSTEKTQGEKSLKMTYSKPAAYADSSKIGGMTHIKLNNTANLSGYEYISFDLYLPEKMSGSHGFQLNFANSNQDGYNSMTTLNEKGPGWINVTMEKSKIGMAKETDWAAINQMRLTWFNYAGVSTETYFLIDNIRAHKAEAEPTPTPTVTYPYQVNENKIMIYDAEDIAPISTAFQTEVALDSANKTQGSNGLKMTYTNPLGQVNGNQVGGMAYIALTKTADLSAYDTVSFDLYLPSDITVSNGFQLNLCTEKSDGYNFMKGLNGLKAGWNTIHLGFGAAQPANGVTHACDKSQINTLRLTWFNYNSSEIPYFIIDNIVATKTVQVDTAVQAVIDAIAALPEASAVTENNRTAANNAKAAYDALTTSQKADVTNYAKLKEVLAALDSLKDPAVEAVITAIDALPAAANVQNSDRDQITAAKVAYDALTNDQKTKVTNVQKLVDVINALNNLPVVDTAVQDVISAIEQLPAADQVTADDAGAINAAKDKYDALTDDQKNQVTNADKLTDVLEALDAATNTDAVKYGDIDEDGDVDANDALIALKYSVGKASLTDIQFKAGEVSNDQKVDAADALLILKKVVGKIQQFPVEE